MKCFITTLLPIIMLVCCGATASAQYDYIKQGYANQSYLPHSLHRVQFGISTVGAVAHYEADLAERDGINIKQHYHEGPTISKGGLGVTAGTFYRLVKMGKRAAIAFDVNAMYNVINWNGIGQGEYSDKEWYNKAVTKQIAVPLGLSLKFGSDARLEKNHRFCLSAGGGLFPSANITRLVSDAPKKEQLKFVNFAATPYIMGEAGFFLGLCFKVRVMSTFGNYRLAKDAFGWQEQTYGYNNFDMNSKSSLIVSLLVMPFSYDWPDNGWWNNSRTMGTFYGGKQ